MVRQYQNVPLRTLSFNVTTSSQTGRQWFRKGFVVGVLPAGVVCDGQLAIIDVVGVTSEILLTALERTCIVGDKVVEW